MKYNRIGIVCLVLCLNFVGNFGFAEVFELKSSDFPVGLLRAEVLGNFSEKTTATAVMSSSKHGLSLDMPLPDGQYAYTFFITFADGSQSTITDPASSLYVVDDITSVSSLLVLKDGKRIIPEGLEHFEWKADQAEEVTLSGDFVNWRRDEIFLLKEKDGYWHCRVRVPRPITFKYIVNNIWYADKGPDVVLVPDSFGEFQSFRDITTTETASATVVVDYLSECGLDFTDPARSREVAERVSRDGEYKMALAILEQQRIALPEIDDSPNLYLEAEINIRYNNRGKAALCWEKIVDSAVDFSIKNEAMTDLAKYERYDQKDYQAATKLYYEIMKHSSNHEELAETLFEISHTQGEEGLWEESVDTLDMAMADAPLPDGTNDPYTHLWVDMYCNRGIGLYYVGRFDEAVESLKKSIETAEMIDTHVAQAAHAWMEYVNNHRATMDNKTK